MLYNVMTVKGINHIVNMTVKGINHIVNNTNLIKNN